MSDKAEAKTLVKDIEGFLNNKEGSLLYDLAKDVKGKGVILEIGSFKGKSTIWLSKGSEQGNRIAVYAVDHHTGSPEHRKGKDELWTFDEFKRNIGDAGVSDLVTPIVRTSVEAASSFEEPIELLFIDGGHDYDSVKSDYHAWSSKVVEGGIIAFHDSEWPGVSQFLEELLKTQNNLKFIRFRGSVASVQKVGRISSLDAFTNRQLIKVIKFRRNIGYKKSQAHSLSKPLYNLVRNLARLYRFFLTRMYLMS